MVDGDWPVLSGHVTAGLGRTLNLPSAAQTASKSSTLISYLPSWTHLPRDPNAPAEPTSAQRRSVQAGVKVIATETQALASTKAIRYLYPSLTATKGKVQEDPTVQIELNENAGLRKD